MVSAQMNSVRVWMKHLLSYSWCWLSNVCSFSFFLYVWQSGALRSLWYCTKVLHASLTIFLKITFSLLLLLAWIILLDAIPFLLKNTQDKLQTCTHANRSSKFSNLSQSTVLQETYKRQNAVPTKKIIVRWQSGYMSWAWYTCNLKCFSDALRPHEHKTGLLSKMHTNCKTHGVPAFERRAVDKIL